MNKLFYKLRHSLDLKDIGVYPQVQQAINIVEPENLSFSDNLLYKAIDEQEIILPTPILEPRANPTDLISCVPAGFWRRLLISSKFKSILELTKHPPMRFFPATLQYRNQTIKDYWYTHFLTTGNEFINYRKSEIWLCNVISKKYWIEEVSIFDYDDYLNKRSQIKSPQGLQLKRVELMPDIDYDFFFIERASGSGSHFVTPALRKYLEAESITGVEFVDINA